MDERRYYLPHEFVQLFLGSWLQDEIIDLVNINLRAKSKATTSEQLRHFKNTDSEEFLQFTIYRMVHSLIKHQRHSIPTGQLEDLAQKLMGINRHNAISSCLSLQAHQITKAFRAVPSLIKQWVSLGTVYCIDESIFPFFGRAAFDKGLLQLIPNKPHDFGLVTYFACQRLMWSNLPIAIDLEPTWLDDRPTPLDIAVALLSRNRIPDQHQHLIADKLWSPESYFTAYNQLGIFYTLSVKDSAGGGLAALIKLASTDLPTRSSRTYARHDQVLQVSQVEDHITTVISNAWTAKEVATTPRKTKGTFESALTFFRNEPAAALCDMFNLDATWLLQPPEKIIFEALGWDVLRPKNAQMDHRPLDHAACMRLTKPQLLPIYKRVTKHKRVNKNISKKKMLDVLFPDPNTAPAPQSKVDKRKRDVADITAARETVRGAYTETRTVYDVWARNWNDVDRMNEDYHAYYFSPGHRTEMKQGLESVIFVMLMNARAFYEEHYCAHTYTLSDNKRSAVPVARQYTIPQFIVEVGKHLVEK